MVKVRFTDKKGKTWTAKFPKLSLKEVALPAKKINPAIRKVEYASKAWRLRKVL